MAIELTQVPSTTFGASPRTFTITAPASGNALIGVIEPGGTTGTKSLLDGATPFTPDFVSTIDGLMEFYRLPNVTGGPTSLSYTWTGGGSAFINLYLYEVSDLAASPVEDTNEESHIGVEAANVTLVSATDNAIAICSAYLFHDRDITATGVNAGRIPTGTHQAFSLYSTDLGAPGSYDIGCTWTGQGNSQGHLAGVVYALSGGGGGSPILVPRPVKQRFFLRGIRR